MQAWRACRVGRAACARRLPPPRKHGGGARRGACAHAPPPRRRKAQLRDVSHLDRKSRLVTAAWRCTPRAGAPPPSEKAVAEVVRIASMLSVMKEGSPELFARLCANRETVRTILFRLNSLLTVESSWGSGHEGPQAHAPKLCCSPEWASTRALRWTVAARRRACIQNSVGRARKPHPAGTGRPVGRGWSRLGAAPGIPRRR